MNSKEPRSSARSKANRDPDWKLALKDSEAFSEWAKAQTGIEIKIASNPVCCGHTPPWEMFKAIHEDRPSLALVVGGRGTGKSYLSALDTHLTSLRNPRHGTKVLGGSRAQSEQIYNALRGFAYQWPVENPDDPVAKLTSSRAAYKNGSEVSILAASSTSVRGPHVPSLKLDEVDEIHPDHFESAIGMCMDLNGSEASILMTSTWHRVGGPVSSLIERAGEEDIPVYTMCIFEVLERCPEARSGRKVADGSYENCPTCPLARYCLETHDNIPKAKKSNGHYSIKALIQKLKMISARTFEADYLCRGPKAEGLWFPMFSNETHVSGEAEYDPALPVHVAIDSGVFTGAVLFQVTRDHAGTGEGERIHVFADYLHEGGTAESNARAIKELMGSLCNGRADRVSTDPAGGSRNAVGPTVISTYEGVGLGPLERWPIGSVADGLSLVESFVRPAEGPPRLLIHPRCKPTIAAFQSYRRARRGGQWQDYPEDPQHPFEELMDSLRGGLRLLYPEGRVRPSSLPRIQARKVF